MKRPPAGGCRTTSGFLKVCLDNARFETHNSRMRIGLGRGLFVLGWGIAVISGCDRSPAPPPQTADAMPAPATRPTADELMSAERTQLDINSAPLSIKLPASWKIVMVDGVSVLEGPTPS